MITAYPARRNFILLSLAMIFFVVVLFRIRHEQRMRAEEHIRARAESGQALLLYVQQQHQSSEEVAYQYIADFVKKHVAPGEQAAIDSLLEQDRQSLLELAQSLLRFFPWELDEI
ncbi:MAG TPA: hypothetical protein VKV40_01310 [Ktedonobacteraceae bacterium]|nr:hypothetical protein [Ktedonobacteraceae bacterium]